MKRLGKVLRFVGAIALLAGNAFAQGNPRGTSEVTLKGKKVSVEYGRPSLKGRNIEQMLSRIEPGQFWRLGADQSTTFSTEADLAFGDVAIPKGSYSVWAQKQGDNSWKLTFNHEQGVFGTEHDPSKDFALVPLKQSKAANSEEMLTMTLTGHGDDGTLTIQWGNLELSTKFEVK